MTPASRLVRFLGDWFQARRRRGTTSLVEGRRRFVCGGIRWQNARPYTFAWRTAHLLHRPHPNPHAPVSVAAAARRRGDSAWERTTVRPASGVQPTPIERALPRRYQQTGMRHGGAIRAGRWPSATPCSRSSLRCWCSIWSRQIGCPAACSRGSWIAGRPARPTPRPTPPPRRRGLINHARRFSPHLGMDRGLDMEHPAVLFATGLLPFPTAVLAQALGAGTPRTSGSLGGLYGAIGATGAELLLFFQCMSAIRRCSWTQLNMPFCRGARPDRQRLVSRRRTPRRCRVAAPGAGDLLSACRSSTHHERRVTGGWLAPPP